jgi:hypothetical protein
LTIIQKYNWLDLPIQQIFPRLLLGVVSVSVGAGLTLCAITTGRQPFLNVPSYIMVITPWAIIYYGYDCIQKNKRHDLENKRLECLLQEKESSAERPAVDIDFITGALNNIQSMIDENPGRSRDEITAFSQLLRKGYLKPDASGKNDPIPS